MKKKKPVNLSLPTVLTDAAKLYAEANGRDLSQLVEDLLRRHLESKGIDTDVPIESIVEKWMRQQGEPGRKKGNESARELAYH